MTDYCEIVEVLALIAASTIPQTVVIAHDHVVVRSDLRYGFTHTVLGEGIAVADTLIPSQYSVLTNAVEIADTPILSVVGQLTLTAGAKLRTQLFVGITDVVNNTARLASSVFFTLDTPVVVSGIAIAATTPGSFSRISETLSAGAGISNTMFTGFVVVVDENIKTTNVVFPSRVAYALEVNGIKIAAAAYPGAITNETTTSGAAIYESILSQLSTNGLLTANAEITGFAMFRDPDAVAWLLNTETGAASWHTNFGFESIAQVGARTLAVGPEGLYELTGDTDDGEQIAARVKTGFWDFKLEQTKRLDNMYFGYTSPGQLALDVEAAESGYAAQRYLLEPRAASEPRNSRVTPGKGLVSRYWRLTISNKDGVPFHVRSMTADLANSNRRV